MIIFYRPFTHYSFAHLSIRRETYRPQKGVLFSAPVFGASEPSQEVHDLRLLPLNDSLRMAFGNPTFRAHLLQICTHDTSHTGGHTGVQQSRRRHWAAVLPASLHGWGNPTRLIVNASHYDVRTQAVRRLMDVVEVVLGWDFAPTSASFHFTMQTSRVPWFNPDVGCNRPERILHSVPFRFCIFLQGRGNYAGK